MNITRSKLDIGLPEPLRFLHITDNHLAFADKRDDARKQRLARDRAAAFEAAPGDCERYLDDALVYAGKNCDLLLHTGDLIDFVSWLNLEVVSRKFSGLDYFFTTGNHEFSLYVGEAFEDTAYKMRSMPQVQPVFKNDLLFASRIFGGINLVGIDNSYYHFNELQLEQFKAEVAKGYPVLLLLHNPICTDDLYDEMMVRRQRECAYLVGCSEQQMMPYQEERRIQQRPTPATLAFIEYLRDQASVKAVITGHLHFDYETPLSKSLMQYVTGGGFEGFAREFVIF